MFAEDQQAAEVDDALGRAPPLELRPVSGPYSAADRLWGTATSGKRVSLVCP